MSIKSPPQGFMATVFTAILLLGYVWVPGTGWVAYEPNYKPGAFVPHPHPGINQIECPPPARPACLPGRA